MADTFGQRIAFEGAEDIQKKLEQIGATGEKAFKQLQTAARAVSFEALTTAVTNLGTAFAGVGASLTEVASRFGSIFGVQITGFNDIIGSLNQITRSAAGAVASIGSFAQQTQLSVEAACGFTAAVAAFGVTTDDMQTAIRRLSVRVQEEWPIIAKQIRDAGDAATQTRLGVERAAQGITSSNTALITSYQNLQQTIRELGRVDQTISDQRKANANSVRSAELSLIDAQARLRELTTGETLDPEQQRRLDIAKATLAVKQAEEKVEQERRKAAQEAEEEDRKRVQAAQAVQVAQEQLAAARLQQEQAALQLSESRKKQIDEEANSIVRLIDLVNKLSTGQANAKSPEFAGLNKNAENIVKGIIGSVQGADAALKNFEGDIGDVAQAGPELQAVLFKIADVFAGTGDAALNTAIAVKLFGRSVSGGFIKALSQGSGALKEQIDQLDKLGLSFNKADVDASKAFKNSSNVLDSTLDLIKNKVGVLFAPIGTEISQTLTAKLREALPAIEQFFKDIVGKIQPLIPDIIAGVVSIGTAFAKFFTETLPVAIRVVQNLLQAVANDFNRFFGTKFTGDQFGLLLLVGQLSGVNDAIKSLIGAIIQLGIAFGLLIAINPFVAALAGITLLLVAIILFPDEVAAALSALTGIIVDPFLAAFDIIRVQLKLLQGDLIGAFKVIQESIERNDRNSARDAAKAKADADKSGIATNDALLNNAEQKAEGFLARIQQKIATAAAGSGGAFDALSQKTQSAFRDMETQGTKTAQTMQGQFKTTADVIQKAIDTAHNLSGLSDVELAKKLGTPPPPVTTPSGSNNLTGLSDAELARQIKDGLAVVGTAVDQGATTTTAAIEKNTAVTQVIANKTVDTAHNLTGLSDAELARTGAAPGQPAAPAPAASLADVARQISEQLATVTTAINEGATSTRTAIEQNATVTQAAIQQDTDRTVEAATQGFSLVNQTLQAVSQAITSLSSDLISAMRDVASSIKAAAASSGGGSSSGGDNQGDGLAGGGLIRGPGTGTSDSIPAYLSHGEYVEPAHVVRQPGVLAFLGVLRATGGDLAEALRRIGKPMRGFAMGGLIEGVSRAFEMPRFAAGGLVTVAATNTGGGRALHPITINMPGGQAVNVLGTPDAVQQLHRAAIMSRIASTGRKQSSVK